MEGHKYICIDLDWIQLDKKLSNYILLRLIVKGFCINEREDSASIFDAATSNYFFDIHQPSNIRYSCE